MARTLGTGDLATGSYGDRHSATGRLGRLAHDWQLTEEYFRLMNRLKIPGTFHTCTCIQELENSSVLALKALALGDGHLALGHLVAGTWQSGTIWHNLAQSGTYWKLSFSQEQEKASFFF